MSNFDWPLYLLFWEAVTKGFWPIVTFGDLKIKTVILISDCQHSIKIEIRRFSRIYDLFLQKIGPKKNQDKIFSVWRQLDEYMKKMVTTG